MKLTHDRELAQLVYRKDVCTLSDIGVSLRITVLFHFTDEADPAAVTAVDGDVTDLMLPGLNDTICHNDFSGRRFRAKVVGRHFDYRFAIGEEIDGAITVTLSLARLQSHEAQ